MHAQMQTIYLSTNGNDAKAGTKEAPIASINEMLNRIKQICSASDKPDSLKIHFGEGIYSIRKPIELTPELTNGVPLIFEGENNGKSIISGGKTLAPFTKVNDRLWKTYLPEVDEMGFSFEQLFINGERRYRAQSPNWGEFYNIINVRETEFDATNKTQAQLAMLEVHPKTPIKIEQNPTGEQPLITFYHNWTISRYYLIHQNDTGNIFCAGRGLKSYNPINHLSRFIIENNRACFDAPGEWLLEEGGWLYYIPCEGETPENIVCTVPIAEKFVIMKGSETDGKIENICFRNISFENTGYRTSPQGYNSAQAASAEGAVIEADFASNIRIENCTIAHTGLYGIWFRKACSDCQVEQCHLYDLGAGGVKIGDTAKPEDEEKLLTHHITVNNCIIQHGGYIFPPAVGVIIFHASDNRVTHNDIADFRYTGISVGWVWGYGHSPSKRNIIEYNHIHHLGWGELSDMGGVYTLGLSEGTSVSHNRVHHIYSLYYGGWGLYTDEGSTGITMQNNLVYKCKSGGFHQHYGYENIIRNNIFAGQIRTQLEATRQEEHTSFFFENNIVAFDSGTLCDHNWDIVSHKSDYNCYFDSRSPEISFKQVTWTDWQKNGQDKHSVVDNPEFANPATGDFTPNNKRMMKKIRFKPFDFTKAGVYGSDDWKKRARLSNELLQAFDKRVSDYESIALPN